MSETTEVTPVFPFECSLLEGREVQVRTPNQGQVALLMSAEDWFMKAKREIDAVNDLPADLAPDDPRYVRAHRAVAAGKKHVVRLQQILGALFEESLDWEEIVDQLATGAISWSDIAALPGQIIAAYRVYTDPDRVMGEDNRAAKRRAGRSRRV